MILLQVKPDSGFWKGASYDFTFTIPALYPHDPPKVNPVTNVIWGVLRDFIYSNTTAQTAPLSLDKLPLTLSAVAKFEMIKDIYSCNAHCGVFGSLNALVND